MKLIILIFSMIILFLILTFLFKNNKESFETIYYLPYTLFLQERNDDVAQENCLKKTNNYGCNSLYPFDNLNDLDSDTLDSYSKVYIPKGKKGDTGDQGVQGPVSTIVNNFSNVNKINTQNDIIPINVRNGSVNINTNNPIMLYNKSICKNYQGEKFCFNLNKLNETLSNISILEY
jgi:hypothetical protein